MSISHINSVGNPHALQRASAARPSRIDKDGDGDNSKGSDVQELRAQAPRSGGQIIDIKA